MKAYSKGWTHMLKQVTGQRWSLRNFELVFLEASDVWSSIRTQMMLHETSTKEKNLEIFRQSWFFFFTYWHVLRQTLINTKVAQLASQNVEDAINQCYQYKSSLVFNLRSEIMHHSIAVLRCEQSSDPELKL